MMKKAEIIEICKRVASERPGWEFTAGAFKNKALSPCVKVVHPRWSFSPGTALSQPTVGFSHKEINGLFKKLMNSDTAQLSFVFLSDSFKEYSQLRFYDVVADNAEEKIRKLLADGILELENHYDFSSEKNLLEKMPKHLADTQGVCYCLVRAYLGDFDFVKAYRRGEFKITRGATYYDWVDNIIEHFGISMD